MYFRLGGGTLKGVSKPGEIVWSRVYVIDAMEGHAIAVNMDQWVLDSDDNQDSIVELCRSKLRDESSHYLGL